MNNFLQKIRALDDEKKKRRQYFFIYTSAFVFLALGVFSWYFLTGRTLIRKDDGWDQHYKALIYYGNYLRSIIKGVFSQHRLIIPAWDFAIGEGNDILETLHYYAIGDPFAFFSVLVPTRFMYVFFDGMILLRMYLSGIAFSCLCFKTGQKSRYAVLAGSLTYVFCYWGIYNAVGHLFFLNPMLYLPMLIIGVEKILRRERSYFFIFTVFLSAISNFYFFYMLALVTVLFVIVRMLTAYRCELRLAFLHVLRIGAASALGVLLAAVVFLPMCRTFLDSSRMSAQNAFHLFYPLYYYARLPALFLVPERGEYWCLMGFSVPTLLAVFLLFMKRKKNVLLKALFLSGIAILTIPVLGQALNGFSFASNRWCWAFALLCAYILTVMWPSLMQLSKKDAIRLVVCLAAYFFICFALKNFYDSKVYVTIAMAFVFIAVLVFALFPWKVGEGIFSRRRKQQIGLLLVFVSICSNSFIRNAPYAMDYVSSHKTKNQASKALTEHEASAIKELAAAEGVDEFYRFSGSNLSKNANMISGVSSTQHYWSLSNPYVCKARSELELMEGATHNYKGYDGRAALTTLASVLYYAIPKKDNSPAPYGFTYKKTVKKFDIYRNDYALPLGYTYDSCFPEKDFKELSATEKQEALLKTCVLEEADADIARADINFTEKELDYTLTCDDPGVFRKDNTFVVTSKDAAITLEFEGLANSETYVSMEGLSFQGTPVYDLYFGDETVDPQNLYGQENWDALSDAEQSSIRKGKLLWAQPTNTNLRLTSSTGTTKNLLYYTKEYERYSNRCDFTVNLGYSRDAATSATIKFSDIGIYRFDSIRVICQPMDDYAKEIASRKADTFENVEIGTNTVKGTVSLDTPKILCLTIPYSKGWHAYVDGKETELYRANIQYMAIVLDEGEHDVQLVYATLLYRAGGYISAGALLIFVVFIIIAESHRKRKNQIL